MSSSTQLVHAETMPAQTEVFGFPIREDVLFTDAKGRPHKGIRHGSEEILRNLLDPLRHCLRKNEVLFYAAAMTAPLNGIEQFTMSWWLYGAYSIVLVFTSERILAFPVRRSGQWRGSIQTLELGDIEQAKAGGWISRTLTLRTRDGKKHVFQRLRVRDAAKIKFLMQVLLAGKSTSAETGWQSLCPQCLGHLTPGHYSCPGCNLQFRSEQKLAWRTLIPGGGYFYVGLTGTGIVAAIIESIFYIELLGGAVLVLTPSRPQDRADGVSVLVGFAIFLGLEKLIMYMHARRFIRWFLPEGKLQPKLG